MNLIRRSLLAATALCTLGLPVRAEVIIQYFETPWDEIYQRLPEIAEIGYESIWTPPPGKSPIGGPYAHAYGGNVGYNSYDRFDLGDHPQRGNWETRYGSRTSLRNMVDNAHQMDLKIYPDIVFNHTGNGPDYRTYPGMVPNDFHGWWDNSQPGGFKRAPRMFEWSPDNGVGGTLHQELVSLMDIVLEFDGRFQGNNGPRYASDPTPFVRHPGDSEKYPYFNQTGFVAENSRQFVTRWINWLGYAMDYDGVRLDAPKHVGKEYFGLPNQNLAERDQSLIYNIQKNFNERRGLSDTNPFDDMYSNYIRRDDALVYSEFFIGSIGETDYWRNPSDRNWGIQARYLDFPRKSQMIMAAFNGGNLAALDNTSSGFSPEEGVIFAHSHDEDPPGKLELAYAYILTRVGVPVVYFTGNNLADNEDKEENGITWMRKGYDGALGDKNAGTIPNLIYIHNQFARGREWTRWVEGDFFAFERYDDTNSNGQPNSGEGLLLTVLNDSGSDQTRNGIQTSFAPGTVLKDYTGRNPNTVTVGSDGKVNITVGGWWGQGIGCWAPFNADGPASGPAITFAGSGVSTMPWVVPGGRDAAAKPRTITKLTGNSATINVFYREPAQGGETVNSGLLKWGQGRNLNATANDIGGKDLVNAGYETMTKIGPGQYQLVADLTNVPEGLHTIKARLFNGRAAGRPALYQTFTTTVYVDRRGPDLTFANLNEGETIQGARVVTVENADRTLHNLTYSINGGPSQQADEVIKGRWRIALDGLSSGANAITLNATEADRGASPAVINTTTVTRNFTVDTTGQSIAINHASGATIAEPFFKTVVTVPTGQGITAADIKLFWNGYEQLPLVENPAGSGKFESTFTGRYRQGGVDKIFYGAFVNGPNFFEAVVSKNGQENRAARRVVFNLYGQELHDSDGDGLPDNIEIENFLSGRNPGPNRALPGDGPGLDNIPNYGEQWSRLNPMNAETFYNGQWDGDRDSDGDGYTNLQELIRGFRISGNVNAYNIYNGASIPPATIGSFASSSLSMSNGNKIVTVTYRPNEGSLANASAVTINITPVGGGTAQSFAMTGGPTEFTYSYTVPAGATSVNYTFSSGATTDSTGGASWSASTSAGFVMDGEFDSQNFVVSDNGMRIYAAIRGNKLYTATWSPKGGVNDHFIFITDQFGNPVNHPWAKAGKVYGKFDFSAQTKPWIGANPDAAYANGFGASGRNWLGNQGKALETEIDLVQVLGSVPRTLYIAVAAYPRADGGNLLSQAPAPFGNAANDIEIPEYQALNTASLRDEDLDGKFDVGVPEMLVAVNGNETDGNYGLRRFYLDEVAGDTSELTVKFKPNVAGSVSNVEVFTNLNRRDKAVLEENPATVTTSSNTYFRAYAMTGPDVDGYYTTTLPVELCGAYRLQVRYKVSGVNGDNYIYYTDNGLRRDCAIVVSPKKALQMNMYEVNPLIVEAKDTTFAGRSTFLDLVNDPGIPGEVGGYNGRPDALNKDHYSALGVNMLWLQPIHPIGVEGRDINPETPGQPFDPGSPYAVRDYWTVAPMLGRGDTAANAMSEFQTFVQRLDQWGVGVMMDGTFNHSAPDAVMGQGAVDLGITNNASVQIRNFNPGWYAKEGFPGTPAANAGEIAIAPDRNDFGNWTDVREFYFGDYDALVKEKGTQNPDKSYPDNAYKLAFLLERDEFAGHTSATRQVWNYFAYYPIYWLEKSGHTASTPKNQSHVGIDGLRCDFAQGLPSQFWEYAINKTRARKWDFIFMAESLDGARTVGNSSRHGVGYRSARHFDVLNENIVFYWRDTFFGYPANGGAGSVKTPKTFDTWKAYDDRRNAFDNVTLLNNLTSHDEVFPHNDVWSIAYGYAQVGALDGIPMLMYGQEAGAQNSVSAYSASTGNFGEINITNNFAKYEANFGKNIPNFKVYNNMASIWNNRTADEWKLQNFYGRVNKARLAAPALQSQNVYFLSKKQVGGGYDDQMFAVGKVKDLGQPAGASGNSVVFAFANNNYRVTNNVAALFDLNAKVPGTDLNYFGIDRGRIYNVKDLLADNANAYVWSTNRTGADLIDNGLYVGLPNSAAGTGNYQAQYLQLIDRSAPIVGFSPPQFATYNTTVALGATVSPDSPVTYLLVGGDTNKVTLVGNQLTINSGTGSVIVRAIVAATADREGATSEDKTITFEKASQTITFEVADNTLSTSDSPVTLTGVSSSGLAVNYISSNPAVASVNGSILTPNGAGTVVITARQPGNDNYDAATEVTATLFVTQSSQPSFESLFPGQTPTSDIDADSIPALMEYGLGGGTSSDDHDLLPLMELSNGRLQLTAVIRTNDPRLAPSVQTSGNLLSASNWTTAGVNFTNHTDRTGVPDGFVRRTYWTEPGDSSNSFIRLRFTLQPPQ